MELKLISKRFVETSAWAVEERDLYASIDVRLIINWHVGFTFCVSVVNKSFCSKNPIAAMLAALESETIGMAKYDRIKENLRSRGMWKKILQQEI
jgi:hypothetical protein